MGACFIAALCTPVRTTSADPHDGTLSLRVQAVPAVAPSRLPEGPQPIWQRRVQGAIDIAPAATPNGSLVVLSAGRVSQLSPEGQLEWSVRIRAGTGATTPVATPSGTVFVTTRGELWRLSSGGRLSVRRKIATRAPSPGTPLVVTHDAHLALALGSTLVLLNLDGEVEAEARLPEPCTAIHRFDRALVLVDQRGGVHRWRPRVGLTRIGTLGGQARTTPWLGANRLLAIVDGARLVEIDLTTGRRRVRSVADGKQYLEYPLVSPDGTSYVLTSEGLLLTIDSRGQERKRSLLRGPAGGGALAETRLLLGEKRIAFATPLGDVGVVGMDGTVQRPAAAGCLTPVALTGLGAERFVVSCPNGTLMAYGAAEGSGDSPPGAL